MSEIDLEQEQQLDPEQKAWMGRTHRRDFLKKSGIVLATSAGVLGSQGWIGPRGTRAANQVNLRYTLWDANQEPAMKQSIALFEKENPNISVSVEQYAWGSYWTKIQTQTAGGNAADVQWAHLAWWPGFMAQGGFYLDESKYIAQDKVDLSMYYQQLLELYQVNGKQTSLPKDWDTICVYYNKTMLKAAGLAEPTAAWSWNPKDGGDFLKYAMKLTVDGNGKTADESGFNPKNIKQYGVISSNQGQQFYMNMMWMNGATGILKAPYSNVVTIDEPASIEAFQFMHDLNWKYYVSPSNQMDGTEGDEPLFQNSKVAMEFEGSWDNGWYSGAVKFPWGAALMPKGPAGRISTFNGLSHVIAASTKHPEEAWLLAKHMDSVESQTISASEGIVFPSIKSLTGLYPKAFAGKNPTGVENFITETSHTGLWPVHPKWTQINTALTNDLTAFWNTANAKASVAIPALAAKIRKIVG
jgi:multiple sugar transport system substrate-binding protein